MTDIGNFDKLYEGKGQVNGRAAAAQGQAQKDGGYMPQALFAGDADLCE